MDTTSIIYRDQRNLILSIVIPYALNNKEQTHRQQIWRIRILYCQQLLILLHPPEYSHWIWFSIRSRDEYRWADESYYHWTSTIIAHSCWLSSQLLGRSSSGSSLHQKSISIMISTMTTTTTILIPSVRSYSRRRIWINMTWPYDVAAVPQEANGSLSLTTPSLHSR